MLVGLAHRALWIEAVREGSGVHFRDECRLSPGVQVERVLEDELPDMRPGHHRHPLTLVLHSAVLEPNLKTRLIALQKASINFMRCVHESPAAPSVPYPHRKVSGIRVPKGNNRAAILTNHFVLMLAPRGAVSVFVIIRSREMYNIAHCDTIPIQCPAGSYRKLACTFRNLLATGRRS